MKTDTDIRMWSVSVETCQLILFAVLFFSVFFFLKHDNVSMFASFSPSEVALIAFSFWEISIFPLINLIQIVAFQGQIRCSLQILFAHDVVLSHDCQLLRKWLFVLFLDNGNRLTMRMIVRVICTIICSLIW